MNEEEIERRMKEIIAEGFTPRVCDNCHGGVRFATMSMCPVCKGTGLVRSMFPTPLSQQETQRTPLNINNSPATLGESHE